MPRLVSIIVPTKNSAATLEACLRSIKEQDYPDIELIVVDNFSTDRTAGIARAWADHFCERGPERSAQRNFGARISGGEFLLFIDSDMVLSRQVVTQCVCAAQVEGASALIIPEESFGQGFWARCKQLERSFYVGVDGIEAARFFTRAAFEQARGYDEKLTSGEDWDLSQRVRNAGAIGRIDAFIYHNEGRPTLARLVRKKYRYARQFAAYTAKHPRRNGPQTSVLARFWLFFSQPRKLFRDPLVGIGMLLMKLSEFGFGALGYLAARLGAPPARRDRDKFLRLLDPLAVLSVFLFVTRKLLGKHLAYSDFVPFSWDYARTLERFFFTWNSEFVGLFEPKSYSYVIQAFFEMLSLGNAVIAQDLFILSCFLLGYYSMRLLLRRLGLHPAVQFVAPFFYILNPVMAAELSNGVTALLLIYCLTPLIFIASDHLSERYDLYWAILFSLLVGLSLMSMQMAIWIALGLVLQWGAKLLLGGRSVLRNLPSFFAHGVLGVLMNAVALLAFTGFSKGYTGLSYIETFRHTYEKTDYYNLFRLIGNNGSSQPLLGYFDLSLPALFAFVFFALIIWYALSLGQGSRREKVAGIYAFGYLLIAMLFMNLVRTGRLDSLILDKNLLVVSARNPQKVFYLFAFCYVLLLALALSRLLTAAAHRSGRQAAYLALTLVSAIYLAQNGTFLTGDFALGQTRGGSAYYIEDKYERLFAQLEQLKPDAQILYLPFDYELQLKTYASDAIVKFRMGGNMLDSERCSDVLADLYDNICEGGSGLELINDKLNVDYVVLDKRPATDIEHDPDADCAAESYYETPYIWGKYEYFDGIFSGSPAIYEDADFKIIALDKPSVPEVRTLTSIFELNNDTDIFAKRDFVTKTLRQDFNYVLAGADKEKHFATVEELFYGSADNTHLPVSAANLDSRLFIDTARKDLYYRLSGGKLRLFTQPSEGLYLDGRKLEKGADRTEAVLYERAVEEGRDYFLQLGAAIKPLVSGQTVSLGALSGEYPIRVFSVADPQRAVFGVTMAKMNAKDVYYYDRTLWRSSNADERVLQKSSDNGQSWTDVHKFAHRVTDPIIVTADGSILVQQDPNDYWSAPAADIYRSGDGGKTFEKVLSLERGGLASWSFDIRGNSILLGEYGEYVSGTVFLSEDSGKSWRRIFTHPETSSRDVHIHKVLFDPYLAGVYYISNGDTDTSRGVWFTTDGGANWRQLTADEQPTWMEATREYLFLFGDLTGEIHRIRKSDLLAGRPRIETVYEATRDQRAQFGMLSFYGGRIDKTGRIFAAGVSYGTNDTRSNDKDGVLLMSSDMGDSWNIIKVYERLPDLSTGASFLSQESDDGKIYVEVNNAQDEILYLYPGRETSRNTSAYYRSADDNLITNASFREGLWDKKVGDCNAYDDNPMIDIRLGARQEGGGEFLQLEAQRHYSCTTNRFDLSGGAGYLFSFDYQSPNAKAAGYYLQFDDAELSTLFEKTFIDDADWHRYSRILSAPPDAGSARLFLYAYSTDEREKIVNRYDNFSLLRLREEASIEIKTAPAFTSRAVALTPASVFNFESAAYAYEDALPDGDFSEGLWQASVEDCNAYDDAPQLGMEAIPQPEGGSTLRLRAKRHIACTSKQFPIKESTDYMLSLSYRAVSAHDAGYFVEFNDPKMGGTGKMFTAQDDGWHRTSEKISVPAGTTAARLYVYAYESDEEEENVVEYDDLSLREMPPLANRYFLLGAEQAGLAQPAALEYTDVDPTKKTIHVRGAGAPFFLTLAKSYHAGWILRLEGGETDGLAESWTRFARPDKLPENRHYKLNGFLNAWYVDPAAWCAKSEACTRNPDGSYDLKLVAEFAPQRDFYILLSISAAALAGSLVLLLARRRTNKHKP